MLKKAGLPFCMAALAAAGVMYGYGGMAGWGVSVRRAVLMFLLFLGEQVIGRSYDTFCALAFAAVALHWKTLPVLGRRIPLPLFAIPWRRVGRSEHLL